MPNKKTLILPVEKKYELYERSVQNTEFEVDFLVENFNKRYGRDPKTLREDFCGTAILCKSWVQRDEEKIAYGVDLDEMPLNYGQKIHLAECSEDERARIHLYLEDVLKVKTPAADIVVAFNFSYMIFKKRQLLLRYFKAVRKSMGKEGMFFLDLFGGPDSQTVMEEEVEHDDFSYFWDCDRFNPITNECLFHIHFDYKGHKYKNVFTYDWRLWGLAELRDILTEAGFSETHAYWEGDDGEGGGDGNFYITEDAENCAAWVSYIVALP